MENSVEIVKGWAQSIFDFLKKEKNLGAVTWISTAFTAISVALMKFFKFVSESGKLAYWKINPNVINMTTDNLLYDIIVTAVFAVVIFALFLIPYFIAKSKIKKRVKALLFIGIITILSLIFLFGSNAIEIMKTSFGMGLCVFVLADLLFLVMFSLPSIAFYIATKPQKSQTKPVTKKGVVIMLIVLIVANILYFYFAAYNATRTATVYRITSDGYAIIYETDDQYYLAKYDDKNKVILKDIQKIIEKNDIEYTWKNIRE